MPGLYPIVLLALLLGATGAIACPPQWDGNETAPLCTCELTACLDCTPRNNCLCFSSGALFNLTDYYAQACQGQSAGLSVAIIVPFAVLILGAVVAYIFVRRRKGRSVSRDKRGSNASEGGHGQPRYISRTRLSGDGVKGSAVHQEYENVFVDPPLGGTGEQGGRRSRKPSRTPSKPEGTDASHGDQPIYANTQEIYYNYVDPKTTGTSDEGVYVIPDQ